MVSTVPPLSTGTTTLAPMSLLRRSPARGMSFRRRWVITCQKS